MEIINIYDENHKLIGKSTKKEAHEKGLWHEVFSCLFINSKNNKVYLQYKNNKHNDLSSYNKIDISVGGHLNSKESIIDGIREIKEESNIDVNYNNLIYIGERIINKYINDNYIIREFSFLHIYDNEFKLNELKSIDDEVLYFIEFDIDELIDFLRNPSKSIKGLSKEGYKYYNKNDFIKGYLEDDELYLNYLLISKKIINKEHDIKWHNNY